MKSKTFHLVVWKEGKHFVSQCLDVDVSSFGATHDEAVANLNEALALYFEENGPGTIQWVAVEQPQLESLRLRYA